MYPLIYPSIFPPRHHLAKFAVSLKYLHQNSFSSSSFCSYSMNPHNKTEFAEHRRVQEEGAFCLVLTLAHAEVYSSVQFFLKQVLVCCSLLEDISAFSCCVQANEERGTFSEEAAGPLQDCMVLFTRVGVLHQDPQGVWIYPLHLHFVLLGLPHVAGEHGRKVVGHRREDQPEWARDHVSYHSERMDQELDTPTLMSTSA